MIYEFTLSEFIDNIEKNGLPQGFGHTFNWYDNVKQGTACALGQGYWNTIGQPRSINAKAEEEFWEQFRNQGYDQRVYSNSHGEGVTGTIINLNDYQKLSLPAIAEEIRIQFASHLNAKFRIEV